MIKFINRITGSEMWVADERTEEYKAAGHKPAVSDVLKEPAKKPEKKKQAGKTRK